MKYGVGNVVHAHVPDMPTGDERTVVGEEGGVRSTGPGVVREPWKRVIKETDSVENGSRKRPDRGGIGNLEWSEGSSRSGTRSGSHGPVIRE